MALKAVCVLRGPVVNGTVHFLQEVSMYVMLMDATTMLWRVSSFSNVDVVCWSWSILLRRKVWCYPTYLLLLCRSPCQSRLALIVNTPWRMSLIKCNYPIQQTALQPRCAMDKPQENAFLLVFMLSDWSLATKSYRSELSSKLIQ